MAFVKTLACIIVAVGEQGYSPAAVMTGFGYSSFQ
jgi:hypothetical protein